MTRNIFVLGVTPTQCGELQTIPYAEVCSFEALLSYEELVEPEEIHFDELLAAARARLDAFGGRVDALIAHWDFPTSVLVPILAAERGLPAPPLASVLACEHKYWSRLAQRESVPECVPRFEVFDPFDEDPLGRINLPFPFWVKPVKSHSSQLGFEIHEPADLDAAVEEIRDRIGGIGNAFDDVLARVRLPPSIRDVPGTTCLAEQVMSGIQAAPEGAVFHGEVIVHGVVDMYKDPSGLSIDRLDYPASTVPEDVQARMVETSARYLRHIGYDDGCFNAEFMWDAEADKLWLIEVNTRISQSHSDLFAKVDGVSNHLVAVDVALGRRPAMPRRQGRFAVASKWRIAHDRDGIVRSVPTEADLARVAEHFPETLVELSVEPGDRLSQLARQDSYRYQLGVLYLGAEDRDALVEAYHACLAALPFHIEPVEAA